MNEIYLTATGNVASHPRPGVTNAGHSVTSFRLASTPRKFDRARGEWSDGPTTWFSVNCWRSLADHATSSLGIGDPVVVHGRLRVKEWTRNDGTTGTSLELDAQSLGHDLTRGTTMFSRVSKQAAGAVSPGNDPQAGQEQPNDPLSEPAPVQSDQREAATPGDPRAA